MSIEFSIVANYFDQIEKISSRLEITDILAELFEKTDKEEIKKIIYLLQGQVAPTFEGKEIGFGEKLIAEGIARVTGFNKKEVNELFSKKGDLGEVVEELIEKKSQESLFTKKLTLKKVFENFEKMSLKEGLGSQETKIKLLAELFNSSTRKEAKYIARIPLGNIRLGVGDPTIMDALAIMIAKQKEKNWLKLKEEEQRKIKLNIREEIEKAYNVYSDLGEIGEIIKKEKMKGLKKIKITPGIPIRPTAAERLPSAKEIIKKLGKCAVEAKYDGFRLLISKENNNVKIFSRQSENITPMFPEIINAVKKLKPTRLFVEGEAIAFNEETNEYYPFQITIQRKRKYDVEKKSKEYPLKLFLFDIVYLEGKNLMQEPFLKRRKELEKLTKNNNIIQLSEMKIIDNAKELENFFEEKISQGLEGIIAKDLNAPYIAGARKYSWIKLKRSYKGTLNDTLDLVIIGYYTGKGKRTQFGLGALLVAAYNKEKDLFESIAKIGTGMSDEIIKELEEKLSKIKNKKNNRIVSQIEPDYWVDPIIVIEVRADEITKSPLYSCAKEKTGLALRFPRMIKFRTDKKNIDATTTQEVIKMFKLQKKFILNNE